MGADAAGSEGAGDDDLLMRPRRDDRRLIRGRGFVLRRATAPIRRLPDFLVIGAMKAGTSTLMHHLVRHPGIRGGHRKEAHFFGHGVREGRGLGWYRAHFPIRRPWHGAPLTGEGTPDYLFDPDVPPRIAETLPDVRLIAILREPAARAVSQHAHEVRMGREALPLAEALAVEEARLAHAARRGEAGRETLAHASYRRRGLYAEQIARYHAAFAPGRLLVLGTAELRHDPQGTLDRAFSFLSLPSAPVRAGVERNRSAPANPPPPALMDELRAWFEPHNARLAALLGHLPDW